MKSVLAIAIVILLSFISCKKKSADPLPPNYGTPSTSNNYGTLQTVLLQYYYGHTFMRTDSALTASFYASPPIGDTLFSLVSAGTVGYNSTLLQNASNQYMDSTKALNIHQANSVWNISGINSVPAFSCSVTPSYPSFIGNNLLPDSVSKAAGCVITLVGASNFSSNGITVEIISEGIIARKKLLPNQTSCTFFKSDLSRLIPSSNAMIIIEFSNGSQQTFGGKTYTFNSMLEHVKYIKLKS